MSDPINQNMGRPREDDRKRERLSVSIAAATNDNLVKWLGRMLTVNPRTNMGRVMDKLVAFAERKKFDPTAEQPKQKGTP